MFSVLVLIFFFFSFVYFPSKCSGAEKYQNMLIDTFIFLVPKAKLDFGPILGPLFKTNGVVSLRIVKTLIIRYGIYVNIFAEKKMWFAKATHNFFSKNIFQHKYLWFWYCPHQNS